MQDCRINIENGQIVGTRKSENNQRTLFVVSGAVGDILSLCRSIRQLAVAEVSSCSLALLSFVHGTASAEATTTPVRTPRAENQENGTTSTPRQRPNILAARSCRRISFTPAVSSINRRHGRAVATVRACILGPVISVVALRDRCKRDCYYFSHLTTILFLLLVP
jgi:hypothetical protein